MSSKFAMKKIRRFFISGMSVFGFIKISKTDRLSLSSYMSLPLLCVFAPRNAFETRCISACFFNIFHIVQTRCFSKICNSVVVSNSIYMINFMRWPFAKIDGPSDSMGSEQAIVCSNKNVSCLVSTVNKLAGSTFSSINLPSKFPRFWVILKEFFEAFGGRSIHGNMVTFSYGKGNT